MISCNSGFRAYALNQTDLILNLPDKYKHETQSYRKSCVFRFSHFELYFALHSCVLSTLQQHLLQFPTIRSRIRLFELKYNNQDDAFLISVLSE